MQKLERTDNYIVEIRIVDKDGIEKAALAKKLPCELVSWGNWGFFQPFNDAVRLILDQIDFFFRHQRQAEEAKKRGIAFDVFEIFENCPACRLKKKPGEYVRPRDISKYVECSRSEHGKGGIYEPDYLAEIPSNPESCRCHCHSERPEDIARGIRCKCIKNCRHCRPENFINKPEAAK